MQLGFYPDAECAFASASEAVPDAMARCQPILHGLICKRAQHIAWSHWVALGLLEWFGVIGMLGGMWYGLETFGMEWDPAYAFKL